MTDVGDFEFMIYDEWGSGIPITDSMSAIVTGGITVMSILALIKEFMDGVLEGAG